MELEFTGEQEELRDSVRSFLEKECPIDVVRAVVETGEAPEKLWGSMVALDWPALAIPEEYGGIGLTILETAVVVEELGRAVAPGPLLATVTQFAPIVREVGTPEQQQRFLSQVATGAIAGTVALADHPRAWALDDVTMTAEPADGGWVLTGKKFAVLAAEGTNEVVVVARAGEGCGAFVVPAADAGSDRGAVARCQPAPGRGHPGPCLRPAVIAPWVSPAARRPRSGIARALQEATVGLALETVGTCDALFQLLLAYLKERQQFGVAIGSFQAMKHKMSNMFLAIERARSLCYSRRRLPSTRTRRPAPRPSPWPRPPATTARTWSATNRSNPSVASGSPGSTTRISMSSGPPPMARCSAAQPGTRSPSPPASASPPTEARQTEARQTEAVRSGESLIAALDLAPHPEGGWYRRTWVAEAEDGTRPAGSAIYYLLLPGEVSAPHRVDATELWHFYDGDPLELSREWPDGRRDVQVLGPDVMSGQAPQVVVDAGVWQSARPLGRLQPRRGDRDAGLHFRGLRAPAGPGRSDLTHEYPALRKVLPVGAPLNSQRAVG